MRISKTLLLFIFLFLSISTLQAQFEKGKFQFGMDAASNLELVFGDGLSSVAFVDWILMPEASYFLSNRASIGLSGFYRSQSGSGDELKEYNIGVLSRYYFHQKGAFSFHAENYLGFGEITASSEALEDFNYTRNILRIGLGVGMNYHFTSNFALSFSIRDNYNIRLNGGETRGSEFSQPIDFRFGARVNLDVFK